MFLAYYWRMIIFIRRFIVLFLLLLQGFTPLVHAHVQTVDGGYGLHIHEFSAYTDKESYLSSLEFFADSGAVIDMNSAIKERNLLSADLDAACVYACVLVFLQQFIVQQLLGFSPPLDALKSSIKYSVFAPRAPPL